MSKRHDLRPEIEDFLYHEAQLLDDREYRTWIELFDDDGVYWVPAGKEGDPDDTMALIYDNKSRLLERLTRMDGRYFFAQQPPTQTSRLVGNVTVVDGEPGELLVENRFTLSLLRRDDSQTLAGTCKYRLVREQERYLIRQKTVWLLNRDRPIDNLTFLV